LGNLDDRSEEVLKTLQILLNHEDILVRTAAAETLVNLEDHSELAVNGLIQLLQGTESWSRSRVAAALGKLGKSDSEIQLILVQWIEQHSDLPNIGSAIDALWLTCD
jgi:HEAT repeat protein